MSEFLTDEEMAALEAKSKKSAPQPNAEFLSDDEMAALESSAPSAQGPGAGEAFVRGGNQGASLGSSDELSGVIGALTKGSIVEQAPGMLQSALAAINPGALLASKAAEVITSDKTLSDVGGDYAQARDVERGANAAASEASPGAYLAGNLVGGALSPVNKVLPKGLIAGGATSGVLTGIGMSEGGLAETVEDGAIGGLLGSATGGLLGLAGKAARGVAGSKAIKVALPPIQSAGKKLGSLTRPVTKAIARYFDNDAIKAGMAGVQTKTQLGNEKVMGAVKTLDELGIFSPGDGDMLAPGIEEIRDRTQAVLASKAEELQGVLSQIEADPRTLTSADDIDLSKIKAMALELAKNKSDAGSVKALQEIDNLVANLQDRFVRELAPAGRAADNITITELQNYKQFLQNRAAELGAFEGPTGKALVEAMEEAAGQIRGRIEKVADTVIDPSQRGIIKTLNRAQEAAYALLPVMKNKAAEETAKGVRGPGTWQNIVKYGAAFAAHPLAAAGVGLSDAAATNTGKLIRAGIPRNAKAVKEWAMSALPAIEAQNPGLAATVQQMMKLPEHKLVVAMQPLLAQFSDQFEPSPYASLMNGKLHDQADRDSHRQFVNESVQDPIQRAKELSALNKDGTVLGGLPQ